MGKTHILKVTCKKYSQDSNQCRFNVSLCRHTVPHGIMNITYRHHPSPSLHVVLLRCHLRRVSRSRRRRDRPVGRGGGGGSSRGGGDCGRQENYDYD